tara:strand:- start:349 stop:552 length:204 start_codon:yes stop_codon:yes gene_type:complete
MGPELKKRVEAAAAQVGASPAQLVRAATVRWLDSPDPTDITAEEDEKLAARLKKIRTAEKARAALKA